MSNNSYLCMFIYAHSDWEELLKAEPYFLRIKRGKGKFSNLCIFNYSQFDSDFTEPLVQEARGIIIDTKTLEVVCWPFRKFANFGESYADSIDWKTARVTEKIDGSIIKVWYFKDIEEWVVSTNSTIDARTAKADTTLNIENKTYYDFFKEADVIDYNLLDKDCTYIFELCSPVTRVIIKWDKPVLYHTGTRNNKTGKEFIANIGVQKPREYALSSITECLEAAKALRPKHETGIVNNPDNIKFEGFVVNDANFNRLKIKSYAYAMAQFLTTTKIKKYDAILICIKGETEEFLTYFPQFSSVIEQYKQRVTKVLDLVKRVRTEAFECYNKCNRDRREFGITYSKYKYSGWGFSMVIDNKTPEEVLLDMAQSSLVDLVETIEI